MGSDIYQDTLYGQLVPSGWDDDSVSELVLLVDGEEEFSIENNEFSKLLANYIDRWITVQGVVTETDDDISVKVLSYSLEDEMQFGGEDAW
ncbi:hypothetical protein [Maridesulfovibrio sp.]|uniref:hypothetical protein n=1 Tax=Maridesulfovibrio sp. TaxID=2795000 RepID=UPI0029F5BCD0|nr:hypothetical protein [Maridesulfovibrio sp.]